MKTYNRAESGQN